MDTSRIGPRPPQRTNRWVWITLATIVTIFLILRIVNLSSDKDGFGSKDKVGIVRVEGPIFTSKTVVEDLESLAQRKDIKAIVLRVNSPGGSIAPSQEIFEKVRHVREIKPIITSMSSVAASGGYYIALGSTSVMANKGTITGSIGVIMEYPVAAELLEKLGLSIETVKSGQLKDAGSTSREVTEDDRKYFQNIIDDLHNQFIAAVAEERNLDVDSVRILADGRVYTGTQAHAMGLIDTLGTYEDAIALAAGLGGIQGKPKIFQIRHRRSSFLDLIMDARRPTGTSWFDVIPAYRWRGK